VRGSTGVGTDCSIGSSGTLAFDTTTGALGAPWTGLGILELFDNPNAVTLGDGVLYVTGEGLLSTEPGSASYGPGTRAYPLTGPSTGCGTSSAERCPVWAVADVSGTPPVLGDRGTTLYVSSDTTGALMALDAATGVVRWTSPPIDAAHMSPALAQGTLYTGTGTGDLVALDAATGAV